MFQPTSKRHFGIKLARNSLPEHVASREAYVVGGIDESVGQDHVTGTSRIFLSLVTYYWKPGAADKLPRLNAAIDSPQNYAFQVTKAVLQPIKLGEDIWPFWGEGIVMLVRQYNTQQESGRPLKLLYIDGGNHRNLSLQERLEAEGVKARFERSNGHGYKSSVHPLLHYLLGIADKEAVSFRIASENGTAENR